MKNHKKLAGTRVASALFRACLLGAMALLSVQVRAQQPARISMRMDDVSLGAALKEFGSVSGYRMNFPSKDVSEYTVTVDAKNEEPMRVLGKLLNGKPFEYEVDRDIITVRPVRTSGRYRTVEGRVVDESGKPLPGAHVKGGNGPFGAVCTVDGRFSCKVPAETQEIEISFVGMLTEKVSVRDRNDVRTVVLREDRQMIDEVYVTGYQTISRERSTASFGFVASDRLTEQMHSDLSASLEGKIAGLRMELNPNTGTMKAVLRGVGTFSSAVGTDPLIVIDNVPTSLALDEINLYNVESITVLKDAAAASIYGALAANGVIVVTTKHAKETGTNVTVNADWFITSRPTFDALDLASTSDIIDYQTSVLEANAAASGGIAGYLSSVSKGYGYINPLYQLYLDRENGLLTPAETDATIGKWRNNDFYREFRDRAWRNAVTQRYNIMLSQKAETNSHLLTFNYENNKQRLRGDENDRLSLYYKSNYAITEWMDINAGAEVRLGNGSTPSISPDYTLQQRYERIMDDQGGRYTSPYGPTVGGTTGYNGDIARQYEGQTPFKSFGFNVLDVMEDASKKMQSMNIRPFFNIRLRLLKMFRYNLMYQYEYNRSKSKLYEAPETYAMRMLHNRMIDLSGKSQLPEGGRYEQREAGSNRYTLRNQIDFEKNWDRHAVTAIAGLEFRKTNSPVPTEQLFYGYDPQTLSSARMDWEKYNSGVGTSMITGSPITLGGLSTTVHESRHRYASFYANASYSYASRYNITGSLRWDYADLFGLDIREQRHPLWSVGGSWLLSEEPFMKDIPWLDMLKLRATYGVNGNVDQNSTTYFVVSQKTYKYPIPSNYLNFEDDDLPNPHLRWEKTATTNIGLDFRILNDVLGGSIEFYNRRSDDLLVKRYMDLTMGAASHVVNNGVMRNRGIEFSLNADIVRTRDFRFSADFTFASNSNKILRADHKNDDSSIAFITAPSNYFMEGTGYNTLWAYRIGRIENGYPIAVDKEGNDLVEFDEEGTVTKIATTMYGTENLVNLGSLTPKYNGAFSLRFGYKGLRLNATFVYAGGNKLRNSVISMNDQNGSQTLNGIADRWSADNPAGVRMWVDMTGKNKGYAGTFQNWWQYGDVNVLDAGYVKLRSLSLEYGLPSAICRKLRLKQLAVRVQVSNLFTLCSAGRGIDPESYDLNGGRRGMSVPRTWSIGLSASF